MINSPPGLKVLLASLKKLIGEGRWCKVATIKIASKLLSLHGIFSASDTT